MKRTDFNKPAGKTLGGEKEGGSRQVYAKTPAIQGLSGGVPTALDEACRVNEAQMHRQIEFRAAIEALDGEKYPTLETLLTFCFAKGKLVTLQSAELMRIFTAFRLQNAYEDMIRLVEECKNPEFTDAQIVREFYAVACNQTGRYDKAIDIAESLLARGVANGEIYGTIGRAWREKFKQEPLQAEGRLSNQARHCLHQSLEAYEKGFLTTFEFYPGINAAYCYLLLGDYAHAKSTARLVQLACLRDGARETMDHYCAGTLLLSSCIAGRDAKEIDQAIRQFLTLELMRKERLSHMIGTLTLVRESFAKLCHDTSAFDTAIDQINFTLQHCGQETFNFNAPPPPKKTIADSLCAASSSYRGLASNFLGGHYVQGNFMLGGQLPDHYLTRADWQQFNALLDAPLSSLLGEDNDIPAATLNHIDDTAELLCALDKVVRRAFGTDEDQLENMMSDGHVRYDATVKALIALAGGLSTIDSRTNISVIMGLGLGDCRQHAQAKQILFDAWQHRRMNASLARAYHALGNDDAPGYEAGIHDFKSIDSVELRVVDAFVHASVKTGDNNAPLYDAQGRLIANEDGVMRQVECHTLNILLRKDAKNKIIDIEFADSFYASFYSWNSKKFKLEDLHIDASGNLIMPAGQAKILDEKTGLSCFIPVELRAAEYSGKPAQVSRDEHGRLLLLGLAVEEGFNLAQKLSQPRKERMKAFESIRRWHAEVQRKRKSPDAPAL